jgi:hypothetical protein
MPDKLLFSGPVETKQDFDTPPAEVRERYQNLQKNELAGIAPLPGSDNDEDEADDEE